MKVSIAIVREAIRSAPAEGTSGDSGAVATFAGVVRGEESGRGIAAIEYEAYQPMAEQEMTRLIRELEADHPCEEVAVIHRIGTVPVGEVSIYVRVLGRHRKEAFGMLVAFMERLKMDVPIWKTRAVSIEMLEIDKALELIAQRVPVLDSERVPLSHALGRVLRADVATDLDSPPFDSAAMDGYAIHPPPRESGYRVVGEIAAGSAEEFLLQPGEAVRIFTGARVPAEAERVVMQEKAKRNGDFVEIVEPDSSIFIRKRGENCRRGDVVLKAGRRLTPVDLSVLASAGVAYPQVTRRARVLHLVTGSELVTPDRQPKGAQIRDSNSILVSAFLKRAGAELVEQVRVGDDAEAGAEYLDGDGFEVVFISGGASVGRYDFARPLLENNGFEVAFDQINLRPGKPTIFAMRGEQIAFAIPGNPVSHWVVLELIVLAALRALHAESTPERVRWGRLHRKFTCRPDARMTYWPCRAEWIEREYRITPLRFTSSGDSLSLAGANALLPIAPEEDFIPPDRSVQFIFYGEQ